MKMNKGISYTVNIRHCVLSCLLVIVALPGSYGQKSIPELWGLHVHDEAHVLSTPVVDHLETELKLYEDSTSNQLAVLIINSLDGDVLEEYSLRVAEKWKLGQKEKDNGALLLVVVGDRKMRIETGQGLEVVLTDAVCNRIIRNVLAPAFRKDDYDGGITTALQSMIGAIGGEFVADEDDIHRSEDLTWSQRLLIGAFIFGVLGIFTFIGLLSPGCAGWFLYAFLIPFYAAFPMMVFDTNGGIAVFLTYLISYPIAKLFVARSPWGKKMAKKMSSGGKGRGWSSVSGWSSGGGSSGGGGGGFSGGGGSFGGGGSSGSW